jgi:hypothetical protein
MSQYSGDITWSPQLRRSDLVRSVSAGASVDYFENVAGQIETRAQEAAFGVQFENNGSANVTVTDTFDRLATPFAIRPALSLPAGDYRYRRVSANANNGSRRKIGATGSASWGEFWSGHSTAVSGGLDIRPNYHLNIDLTYSRNQAELPQGAFTTQLVGARILYGFSPRAFLNAFLQYNADTRQVSSNIRFNVTHHPLSDLYVVYNDRRDTTNGRLVERALIVKVTNLFVF